jgi:hypothetical protein
VPAADAGRDALHGKAVARCRGQIPLICWACVGPWRGVSRALM